MESKNWVKYRIDDLSKNSWEYAKMIGLVKEELWQGGKEVFNYIKWWSLAERTQKFLNDRRI